MLNPFWNMGGIYENQMNFFWFSLQYFKCVFFLLEAKPNPRRIVQKNKIVFKNVTKEDSQVLQCIATNVHGSVMSDVYLNVLGKFIDRMYSTKEK